MTDEQITLNASQYCDTMNDKNAELDAERKIFQGIVEKKNDQLTKAKELLRFWINNFYDGFNHSNKYEDRHKAIVETQQFLKENANDNS